jgi:hypothetical protein
MFQRIQLNEPTVTTVRSIDCSGRWDVTIETPVHLHTTRNYRATMNTRKDKQNEYDKVEQRAVINPLFPETKHYFYGTDAIYHCPSLHL